VTSEPMRQHRATIARAEALRRDREDLWAIRSFHASSDGDRQSALAAAARSDQAPPESLTRRGALKTYIVTGSGPYISLDGRCRTREIGPTDAPAKVQGWSERTPWVLERYAASTTT
jgi:hypothetical protein